MNNSNKAKNQTSLTVVFYNQLYGYMIVPYAVERNMRCRIAIEPTISLSAKTTEDDLGSAVKEGIKIAINAPETDIEKNGTNEFWIKTRYKGFRAFSNHFQSINVNQCENLLKIDFWVSTSQKGYIKDESQKPIEVSATLTDAELGAIIKNIVEKKH